MHAHAVGWKDISFNQRCLEFSKYLLVQQQLLEEKALTLLGVFLKIPLPRIVISRQNFKPLPFPAQYSLTLPFEETGDEGFLELFAGQSVALTREMPASDLVHTLAEETTTCLKYRLL